MEKIEIEKEIDKLNEYKKDVMNYIFLLKKTINQLKVVNTICNYSCIFCCECENLEANDYRWKYKCEYCLNEFTEIYEICQEFEMSSTKILANKKIIISKLEKIINLKLNDIKNIIETKNIQNNIKSIKNFNKRFDK